MKIEQLNTKDGGTENPCELISNYLLHELDGGTLVTWLQTFDFDSRNEIEVAIRLFLRVVYGDAYMQKKHLNELNPMAAAVFSRCKRIYEDQGKFDKYPNVTAGEIWHGGYNRQRLEERTAKLFGDTKPNARVFATTCARLKEVYGLTDTDINKLHFFVEQVKAGEAFPNSLRRMLYIWGQTKQTGKTTSATMLVSLLNGDMDEQHIARYSSTLSNEMQIKNFAVPKISECNVVLMDECFYADMGKTYADFKRFITSAGGRARLPFGQEFEWQGYPNYVATSNDPLKVFIKDWGDRRYLSVEFKDKPRQQMTMAEIKQLWADFILNSQRTQAWEDWANEIAPTAEEIGERTEVKNEFVLDLTKTNMLKLITDKPKPASRFCSDAKITVKTFVDWFAQDIGTMEAHKRKKEIEEAVIEVYGQKYSTTNYWLLEDLQATANRLQNEMWKYGNENGEQAAADAMVDEAEMDLPF